jgi:hypothetical protein
MSLVDRLYNFLVREREVKLINVRRVENKKAAFDYHYKDNGEYAFTNTIPVDHSNS